MNANAKRNFKQKFHLEVGQESVALSRQWSCLRVDDVTLNDLAGENISSLAAALSHTQHPVRHD